MTRPTTEDLDGQACKDWGHPDVRAALPDQDITEVVRQSARNILRALAAIDGLSEGQFDLIEQTRHHYWESAVDDARARDQYYLTVGGTEVEVTQEDFIQTEHAAGFRPKPGCGPVATGGFSNGVLTGRVDHTRRIAYLTEPTVT